MMRRAGGCLCELLRSLKGRLKARGQSDSRRCAGADRNVGESKEQQYWVLHSLHALSFHCSEETWHLQHLDSDTFDSILSKASSLGSFATSYSKSHYLRKGLNTQGNHTVNAPCEGTCESQPIRLCSVYGPGEPKLLFSLDIGGCKCWYTFVSRLYLPIWLFLPFWLCHLSSNQS